MLRGMCIYIYIYHSRFKHSGHLLHCGSHVHLIFQSDALVAQIAWHLFVLMFAVVDLPVNLAGVGLSVALAVVDLSPTGAVGGLSVTLAVVDVLVTKENSDSKSRSGCVNGSLVSNS